MDPIGRIYLGIDPAGNHKPFRYVALDEDGRLLVIGEGRLEDMLAYLAGQSAALVALNGMVVRQAGEQESLFPDVPAGGPLRTRRADLELEQMGIHAAGGADGKKALPRARNARQLYTYLVQFAYQPFPAEQAARQVLETNCEAAFTGLIEKKLYDCRGLEGRMQRQMILFQQGLPVGDPMDFLEEVTPRKLAQGLLPLEKILPAGELDAWMAARVAWLAGKHPERVRCLGVPEEGQIYLPVR